MPGGHFSERQYAIDLQKLLKTLGKNHSASKKIDLLVGHCEKNLVTKSTSRAATDLTRGRPAHGRLSKRTIAESGQKTTSLGGKVVISIY